MKTNGYRKRTAFTLVELLVAIIIILMLAALMLGAYSMVRSMFRGLTVQQQISQLEHALEMYKQKYGDYPPDGTNADEVRRHILKRWPKVLRNKSLINTYTGLVPSAPHKALLFWLCGPPRGTNGSVGFSTDVNDPFGIKADGAGYTFDPECTTLESPMIDLSFDQNPRDGRGTGNCNFTEGCFVIADKPIVYFKAEKDGYLYTKNNTSGRVPKVMEYANEDSPIHMAAPYMRGK